MPEEDADPGEKPRPIANDHQGSEIGKPVAERRPTGPIACCAADPEDPADRGEAPAASERN
jgi:hypothetical protein